MVLKQIIDGLFQTRHEPKGLTLHAWAAERVKAWEKDPSAGEEIADLLLNAMPMHDVEHAMLEKAFEELGWSYPAQHSEFAEFLVSAVHASIFFCKDQSPEQKFHIKTLREKFAFLEDNREKLKPEEIGLIENVIDENFVNILYKKLEPQILFLQKSNDQIIAMNLPDSPAYHMQHNIMLEKLYPTAPDETCAPKVSV